jgi:LmbE family N-acetylglucosaminyl deacetylase
VTVPADPLADPLAGFRSALAVVAHPDDETFGLGAVLSTLVGRATQVSGLCFTHGEASTLGHAGSRDALRRIRARELADAVRALGCAQWDLLAYPDGHLDDIPVAQLAEHVVQAARTVDADLLVAFDEGGVTDHPDHQQATRAALAAGERLELPVLGWTIDEAVGAALDREFGTRFRARPPTDVDFVVPVDRSGQRRAIVCHTSQSADNPVLWRRLEHTGGLEALRWLAPARPAPGLVPAGRPTATRRARPRSPRDEPAQRRDVTQVAPRPE